VAPEIQARIRCDLPNHIENLGKRALEQSGKHRVNENDEEIFGSRGFDARVITGMCDHKSFRAMPTRPREARTDDRLRIERGCAILLTISRFPDAQLRV
jgi:hypothetical protein